MSGPEEATPEPDNEYLDYYFAQLKHQQEHGPDWLIKSWDGLYQPNDLCFECLKEGKVRKDARAHFVKRQYSWAVPDEAALAAIAKNSPNGVVECGAGGGYWAGQLRAYGVDVIAYDPSPPQDGKGSWHNGREWSPVKRGDHSKAAKHPERTLLLVWPSYADTWGAEAVAQYHRKGGQVVVYVGEGDGGCTGDANLHRLLGAEASCWHGKDDDCECPGDDVKPLFTEAEHVAIPQWFGLHDALTVHRRQPAEGQA